MKQARRHISLRLKESGSMDRIIMNWLEHQHAQSGAPKSSAAIIKNELIDKIIASTPKGLLQDFLKKPSSGLETNSSINPRPKVVEPISIANDVDVGPEQREADESDFEDFDMEKIEHRHFVNQADQEPVRVEPIVQKSTGSESAKSSRHLSALKKLAKNAEF
ncbi:hypothetical protein Q9L42_021280 (plasmid) [Methylomarinum sp. Ch1-1]|uniref:Uncharacterized protein n=1 Tax=Methylomarinum roseum TaxID=3067653 RepID=A0AAU7P1N0_9GAMM|nr:hypothetical protein [Methylomarinum sp. Ch1-1]MDP4523195.1 hypothetical protein [Methylomarinum sp. Ch1-1]